MIGSMKKRKPSDRLISNQRARFDYDIVKTYVAGIALTGAETKSLRFGHGVLRGAFVRLKPDGAWLDNMQVNPLKTNAAHLPEETRLRPRKLLLKKRELDELEEAKVQGQQVVALRIFTNGRYIKVELGIGRGKKKFDKRQVLKKRDAARGISRELKSR